MSDAPPQLAAHGEKPLAGWVLAIGLAMFAATVLGLATLGWIGVAAIVAAVIVAYGVLLRWARWPRPVR